MEALPTILNNSTGTVGNAYSIWADAPLAGDTCKIATYTENLCVGTATVATNPPSNGALVAGTIQNTILANGLLRADASHNITTCSTGACISWDGTTLNTVQDITTGANITFSSVKVGTTAFTYNQYSSTVTATYNTSSTGALSYKGSVAGNVCTLRFGVFTATPMTADIEFVVPTAFRSTSAVRSPIMLINNGNYVIGHYRTSGSLAMIGLLGSTTGVDPANFGGSGLCGIPDGAIVTYTTV